MSHQAVGRILLGAVPPWDEPQHVGAGENTIWLDTSSWTLRVRTAAQPATGQEIGASAAVIAATLAPLTARVAALEAASPLTGSLPAGVIVMWSGTLASIPAGWALADGLNGRPDLRDKFVRGAAPLANPGATGGSLTHGHAGHSDHAITQPGSHANHVVTQPGAHAAHTVTQPGSHVNHTVTQPAAHLNHVVTQPANHVVTQPAAHAALATHAHELPFIKVAGATGALRMLAPATFGVGTSRAPESTSAAPTANTTAAAVALSQAVSGGTPSAHSGGAVDAHSGAAVDAHSAHTGGAVDAHSAHVGTAVDAHSPHSGAAVDAHSVHTGAAVDAHSAHIGSDHTPPYYTVLFLIKL